MDQVKIGRFIATVRKEQNLTQRDLAERIGVTDRAVSKWENGRGLPELSLIKPLCDALSLSVNELFCGERIAEEQLPAQAETNLIDTLDYSHKKIQKTKVLFLSLLAAVIAVILLLVALFAVDVRRMQRNLPVVFSTWGLDYVPPVNLNEEEIEIAIKAYLVNHGDAETDEAKGVKTFAALRTYLLEEQKAGERYVVYAWVLQEQYYAEGDAVTLYSSFSTPYQFIVQKTEGGFAVTDSRYPRDGSYYAEDMNTLFPKEVVRDMDTVHRDGTYERLQLQIDEQTRLYFHTET